MKREYQNWKPFLMYKVYANHLLAQSHSRDFWHSPCVNASLPFDENMVCDLIIRNTSYTRPLNLKHIVSSNIVLAGPNTRLVNSFEGRFWQSFPQRVYHEVSEAKSVRLGLILSMFLVHSKLASVLECSKSLLLLKFQTLA